VGHRLRGPTGPLVLHLGQVEESAVSEEELKSGNQARQERKILQLSQPAATGSKSPL
jgi:hypothetical protein